VLYIHDGIGVNRGEWGTWIPLISTNIAGLSSSKLLKIRGKDG